MPAPATANGAADLKSKLKAVEDELAALRERRAVQAREADSAKAAFAATPGHSTNSVQFKQAQAAVSEVKALDEQIAEVQAGHIGILRMLGQEPGATGKDGAGSDTRTLERLKSEPGRWLAAVLDRRKGDVQRLPDEVRFKTLSTGANVSTVEESAAVIDLLSPQSVVSASGVQTIRIDSTEARIPRFTTMPVAGWVAELAAFPTSDAGLELVSTKPPKVGLVSGLSIELFSDLSSEALAMVQNQLLRAVALAFDHGILFGSGTAPEPRGVANTTGILTETGVPLTNLSGFASAIGDLIATNARPGALVMNPTDFGTLLGVTEQTGSNVPLWQASVAGGAQGLRLPYFDVPLYLTPAAPVGTALLYDPACIVAVVRKDVDLAVDPYYDFDHGEVGLRVYLRGSVVVGQADGAVNITFA
jgi:HK97 family phage major capsid protein